MNKRYIIKIFAIIAVLGTMAYMWVGKIVNHAILTDSGFDYSYSGGGSSGGGYSGSSWSSGDYSSYRRRNDGPSEKDDSDGYFFICMVLVFLVIPTIDVLKGYKKGNGLALDNKLRKTEDDIQKIIPNFNLEEFLNDRLSDFINIQKAWASFNYDELRSRLTDELYNQYAMQLKTLEMKNQKNVMHSFEKYDMMVTSAKSINNRYEIKVELLISFYDFIEQNGKLVRGNKKKKANVHYEMIFVSSVEAINKCPTCGAEISDNASVECSFCHNVITRLPEKWLLSKKQVINQR